MNKILYTNKNGNDLCVCCKTDTGYKTEQPISERLYYVDGAGQMCRDCFIKVFNVKYN